MRMDGKKLKNAKETQDASPLLGHTYGPFSRLYMHCYTTIQIHLHSKPLKDSPDNARFPVQVKVRSHQ